MKIALVLHGYPPELVGGTELSARTLAHNLVALGHEVVVIAGTMDWAPGFATTTSIDEGAERPITVHRLHRGDLYFDHWHKSREPRVARAFAAALERERPDVVHVHHWVRLTDDLVAVAARLGVPAVVTLHDLWTTCLLTFRVRPDTRRFCELEQAPANCLDCAGVLRPRTPWVSRDEGERRFAARVASLRRELSLARVRIAASASHAATVGRFLAAEDAPVELLPPGVDVELARRTPRPLPGPGEPLCIGAWGHLAPLKGADVLLEALRRLPDPRAVRLVLAGDDVDPEFSARLRELAEGLDVQFCGAYDVATLDRHPVTDVHLMATGTRAHESWGLVLDEALLVGLPSLLPDAGALGERARDAGFAALYAPGDPDDLARVIAGLLADPARIATLRAAIPAVDGCRLTGREHARRTLPLYARAIAAGAPPVEPADAEEERRQIARQDAWDEALRGATAAELGFEAPADGAPPPLRILSVVHDYLPAHIGGTEIHAHQMACHLRARGHATFAAFTERDLGAAEGTVRRGEFDGVTTLEVVHHREYRHVRETFRPPVTPGVFAALLEELRPDVVHFHHFAHWGAECAQLARAAGAVVVATLHDFWLICDAATLLRPDGSLCHAGVRGECSACLEHYPLPGDGSEPAGGELEAYRWAEVARDRLETSRWFLRAADRVVCPSHFLAERMVAAGVLRPEQVVVMPAGYPGPVHPLRPARRGGPLRVGYVGGIYPSKGVHVLVDAMRHVAPGAAELHVHGILDWFPDYVERLRAAAEGLPVTFHGRFEPATVDAVLQSVDVLVVPSVWYENMPLTIQEAFRNGVPVVVTGIGGMAEAVRDGVDGLHFPRGDARALADVLGRLAADRDLLERLAAGRPAVATVEAIGDRLAALYRECLERRAATAPAGS